MRHLNNEGKSKCQGRNARDVFGIEISFINFDTVTGKFVKNQHVPGVRVPARKPRRCEHRR